MNDKQQLDDACAESDSKLQHEDKSTRRIENGLSALSLQSLEDLILEAYNNMQSDGESIFLPDDVAKKLHDAAEMHRRHASDAVAYSNKENASQNVAQSIQVKEEKSSATLNFSTGASPDASFTHTSSSDASPRSSPISLSSPPLLPVRARSPSIPSAMFTIGTKPVVKARNSRASLYEIRREAAQKIKEEKAQREQQARELARKQRDEARRLLEDTQKRELEEKKQKVQRIREQRRPSRRLSVTR